MTSGASPVPPGTGSFSGKVSTFGMIHSARRAPFGQVILGRRLIGTYGNGPERCGCMSPPVPGRVHRIEWEMTRVLAGSPKRFAGVCLLEVAVVVGVPGPPPVTARSRQTGLPETRYR